ncbi:MAG: translation initiation factor IF-2 [Planctomycetaceae bacterium]|nr:translation initiation factor IF-2 [Planctomycetaceae bacterium]
MKIRIFALARELGLDSKVLIGLCDEAGITLRNALATLTPEERDRIVEYVKNRDRKGAAEPASDEPLAPTRDLNAGKIRDIRVLPSKASRSDQQAFEEELPEAEEAAVSEPETAPQEVVDSTPETETTGQTSVVESTVLEPEIITEEPTSPVPDSPAESASDDEPGMAAEPVETIETPKAPPTPVRPVQPTPSQRQAAPLQRMRRPAQREMRPIGSIKDRDVSAEAAPREKEPEKPKERERPAPRPLVAAPPSYQPPVAKAKPKKPVEKAMKPDMALSDIVDRASPLADQLRQLKQARAEHEEAAQGGGERTKQSARRGSLLNELRESREAQRQAKKMRRKRRSGPADLKTTAQIQFPITVRALSEAIGRPAKAILSYFFKDGRMITINDELSEEDALEVAMELGVDLEIKRGRDIEAELLASLDHDDDAETLQPRPPIITILGHVDHGKTTLVDKLRNANVAAGEAGGITQHIAAYQVERNGRRLTFVDTPGHAAFGEMRARGANVTDIIVLVIAADDGVMPQTVECISHAKNAGVPIVVALNKMDLPEVDDQKTLQQLAQHELLPAEWGGEVEVVRTSGATGMGLDDLIETLTLTSELHEFKANPDREAIGVCLEAFLDEGKGVVSWMIVQKGTLHVGDCVLCGTTYGRIRAIYDDRGNEIEEAGPSMPVKVAGLSEIPTAGVHFFVMEDIDDARNVAETRMNEGREQILSRRGQPRTLEDILNAAREGEGAQTLPLIIKADTPGSLEAIRGELGKFEHPEVKVAIVHEGVGGVNESDVYLAAAAEAVIIAFHVIAEDRAEHLAEKEGVDIRRYNIIYEVTEQIRQSLEGMLRPERVEVATGRAIVLQTFAISRFGTIAGCRVLNGTISRDNRIHVIRDNTVLNDYRIGSLKREKDDAKEVREGMECGIRLEGFNDVKEGDLLEAFRIDEIQRTLS